MSARNSIEFLAGHAISCRIKGKLLGIPDNGVEPAALRIDPSEGHRSGEITVVATVAASKINRNKFTVSDFLRGSPCVRQFSALTARNDRFKCIGLGTVLAVEIPNFSSKVEFAHPFSYDIQNFEKHFFGKRNSFPDQIDFRFLLDGYGGIDDGVCGGKGHPGKEESEFLHFSDTEVSPVDPNARPCGNPGGSAEFLKEAPAGDDSPESFDLFTGLARVPAVGKEPLCSAGDKRQGVRTGELGQVPDMRDERHKKSIESQCFQSLPYCLKPSCVHSGGVTGDSWGLLWLC